MGTDKLYFYRQGYTDGLNNNIMRDPPFGGWQATAYYTGFAYGKEEHNRHYPYPQPTTQETIMNTDFKIEDNVAIPGKGGPRSKYPWTLLEVNQSFFIPASVCRPQSVSSLCAGANTRHHPKRFIWRLMTRTSVMGEELKGAQVWRVV